MMVPAMELVTGTPAHSRITRGEGTECKHQSATGRDHSHALAPVQQHRLALAGALNAENGQMPQRREGPFFNGYEDRNLKSRWCDTGPRPGNRLNGGCFAHCDEVNPYPWLRIRRGDDHRHWVSVSPESSPINAQTGSIMFIPHSAAL